MHQGVLTDRDYRFEESGYLIDNLPWQEEIRKRREASSVIVASPAQAETVEFPVFPAEPVEGTAGDEEASGDPAVPSESAEELVAAARAKAEETARGIEQAAKRNAFEILEKARWEADDLAAKAKEESEKEIQHLKETAEQEGRKEGAEKGRKEGYEVGRAEGERTYTETLRKWDGLLQETVAQRRKLLSDLKPFLLELVEEGLRRCLKREAESGGLVAQFAEEALQKALDRVQLRFHVNPQDLQELESRRGDLTALSGAKGLEIVADPRVERGGVLLETEAGSVDARLGTVVDRLKGSLAANAGVPAPTEGKP